MGNAEECVSVEDEGDEELTGEFRIVEGCASGVGGFPVAAATPDTVRTIECMEAISTAVRTGSSFPDCLETPLDYASSGSGRNSITSSSASSDSLWPKAGRSSCIPVFAGPEALILLVPPVY